MRVGQGLCQHRSGYMLLSPADMMRCKVRGLHRSLPTCCHTWPPKAYLRKCPIGCYAWLAGRHSPMLVLVMGASLEHVMPRQHVLLVLPQLPLAGQQASAGSSRGLPEPALCRMLAAGTEDGNEGAAGVTLPCSTEDSGCLRLAPAVLLTPGLALSCLSCCCLGAYYSHCLQTQLAAYIMQLPWQAADTQVRSQQVAGS